jgi:transcriptional regulator with XRE-family HTH domain
MRARVLIARNLRRLRVASGTSQEELALEARIEPTYLSRLEREAKAENPSIDILERLAKALGVGIEEMFDAAGAAQKVRPLPAGRKKNKPLRKIPKPGAR